MLHNLKGHCFQRCMRMASLGVVHCTTCASEHEILVPALITVVCCNSLCVDCLSSICHLWCLLHPSSVSSLQSYPPSSPCSLQPAVRVVYQYPELCWGPGSWSPLKGVGCILLANQLNFSGADIPICKIRTQYQPIGYSFLYHYLSCSCIWGGLSLGTR